MYVLLMLLVTTGFAEDGNEAITVPTTGNAMTPPLTGVGWSCTCKNCEITLPGMYYLETDARFINNGGCEGTPAGDYGIAIQADGVVLDLNGHAVSGPSSYTLIRGAGRQDLEVFGGTLGDSQEGASTKGIHFEASEFSSTPGYAGSRYSVHDLVILGPSEDGILVEQLPPPADEGSHEYQVRVVLERNTVIGAGEHGIRVAEWGSYAFMDLEVGQSIIRDNHIAQCETGLYVGPGSGVLVQDNLIHGGDVGMVLSGSRFAVEGNLVSGVQSAAASTSPLGRGIAVSGDHPSLRGNLLTGSYTGAQLEGSTGGVVAANYLLDNWYHLMGPPTAPAAGLLLDNTEGVAVRDNVFLGNDTGAMLAYPLGDTLLDNTGAGNSDHWAATAGAAWNDNGDNYATP